MTLPPLPPLPERTTALLLHEDHARTVLWDESALRTYAEQYGRLCAEAERADAERWRYVRDFQDQEPSVDPFMAEMWRKSNAKGQRQPTGKDLEEAVDKAIRARGNR